MLNDKDLENLTKATHDVNFLIQDIDALLKSNDQATTDIAIELLEQARQIEQKLLILVNRNA